MLINKESVLKPKSKLTKFNKIESNQIKLDQIGSYRVQEARQRQDCQVCGRAEQYLRRARTSRVESWAAPSAILRHQPDQSCNMVLNFKD